MHNTKSSHPAPLPLRTVPRPAARGGVPLPLLFLSLFTFHFSLFTSLAVAADAATASDPTRPSPALADTLRTRIDSLDDLSLRALVVGPSGEGAALLGTRDFTSPPVRRGSVIHHDIDGITLPLAIQSITPEGVTLSNPDTPDSTFFLPGGFTPLPPPDQSSATVPSASESGSGRPVGHPSPSSLLRYIELTRVPLSSALRLIADQSGANLSASASTADTPVSILLRNVTPETAVAEICRAAGLWHRRDPATGIIRVTSLAEYEDSLSSFREEQTETFTLRYPNVLEVAAIVCGLYPERTLLSLGDERILDGEKDDIAKRFERFNLLADSSSGIMPMTPSSVSASSSSSGDGTISFNGGRVSVVPQLPRLSPTEAANLSAAETADPATFEHALADIHARNANIFLTVSRKNGILVVRTSDAKALDDIRALVRRLDVPTPMVLLEVKILELSLDDGFNSSFEYQFSQDYNTKSSDSSKLVKTLTGFPGLDPLSTDARSDSLAFRLLSSHLQMRIQLLETEGKAKTLATPLLLTANNEVSRLFIGEERPMVRNITSQTIANGDTTITVPQTEFDLQNVGTMLLITPNINADRTVTLRLLQENSDIVKDGATIPFYSATDGGLIQNVSIDVVSSRSITGTFIAKDNLVTAIGGLVKETESIQESRIPILGRIPLLGWLFRSTEKVTQRTELIVLIRPHILTTPDTSETVTQDILTPLSAHPARDARPSLNPPPDTGAPSPAPSPWR